MKYLIDNTVQLVHRSNLVGDVCELHTTPFENRSSSHSEKYITQLIKHDNYKKCPYCYKL